MGQTKRGSVVETITNVIVGYIINIGVQAIVFPQLVWYENLGIGAIFTAVSIIRGYSIRRFFNWARYETA